MMNLRDMRIKLIELKNKAIENNDIELTNELLSIIDSTEKLLNPKHMTFTLPVVKYWNLINECAQMPDNTMRMDVSFSEDDRNIYLRWSEEQWVFEIMKGEEL